MAGRLQDKVAVVTGSSSGIGEAIALLFASQGAIVTLCGRDAGRLKSVVEKVVKANGGHKERVLTVAGDLNDKGVRKDIIDQTVKKFGRLDVLVANAGVANLVQSIRDGTEESYDQTFDTNVKSVFFLIQHAVPQLEKTKGNIILISSDLGVVAMPNATIYSMSKAALDHLTSCLAVDLGAKGIRVNAVRPGYIPTNLSRGAGDKMEEMQKMISKFETTNQPLKERVLNLNDIAEAVAFLASDAAGCITGEHVTVDGGRSYSGSCEVNFM
jgi:NAD(P)-dependent dehydrogenase (short-subunit alcohol dehydrogenase family)